MNAPIYNMACRVHFAVSPNPRAIKSAAAMYKAARDGLAAAISFSPEEAFAKLMLKYDAVVITRDQQVKEAWRVAHTDAGGKRAEARIKALYEKELAELEAEIVALKVDPDGP